MVFHHVTDENPERGKCTRIRRNNDAGNPQRLRQVAGMHGAGAAKRDQRKLPWIMTALDRHNADRFFHISVHHAHHAGSKLFKRQATMIFLEPLGNNLLCARQVELKVAAKKLVGESSRIQSGSGRKSPGLRRR